MSDQAAIDERVYEIECPNGHKQNLCPTLLESLIEEGQHDCHECGETMAFSDDKIDLECHVCNDILQAHSLEEASIWIDHRCECCKPEISGHTFHVPGSLSEWRDMNDWHPHGTSSGPLDHGQRTDYWEGVIHFCSLRNFASIVRDGILRASPTSYFDVPAVCLTEATASGWDVFREKYGKFGFVFRKNDLIRVDGGPISYLSKDRIQAQEWHDKLKPMIDVLVDPSAAPNSESLLWEREWRTPRDIDFTITRPYAVITEQFDLRNPSWREIFQALRTYGELLCPEELGE